MELPKVNIERLKNRANMTNCEIACLLLGWQGGTIHQVSQATGLSVEEILNSKDIDTLINNAITVWENEEDESHSEEAAIEQNLYLYEQGNILPEDL
jgi:hypothetical protein